eukprot:TRINITY_DN3076_c0_g1_i14.p3 TRINITY_DN3076_c0_g1~~TRINITY_DN3076_c0_g1_i14.p3  ORF type:complete len:166 (-),score=34.94 TRINITY_DN3076_c0_g1_i14:378-875(-)
MIVSNLGKAETAEAERFNNVSLAKFASIAKVAIKDLLKHPEMAGKGKGPLPRFPLGHLPIGEGKGSVVDSVAIPQPLKSISENGVVNFSWDSEACSEHISLSDHKMRCFLMEAGYCFRSVVGSTGIQGGIAYWEIQVDSRNENELKVGVVARKSFNYNTVLHALT